MSVSHLEAWAPGSFANWRSIGRALHRFRRFNSFNRFKGETHRLALEAVRGWFARFVSTVDEPSDLDLLALWAAHTHLAVETYTTPAAGARLPGARVAARPPSSSTSSGCACPRCRWPRCPPRRCWPGCSTPGCGPSSSTRPTGPCTRQEGRRGGLAGRAQQRLQARRHAAGADARPRTAGQVSEMPTYAPVAMAGNNPQLPEDTRSRCIRVLLMPDLDGTRRGVRLGVDRRGSPRARRRPRRLGRQRARRRARKPPQPPRGSQGTRP